MKYFRDRRYSCKIFTLILINQWIKMQIIALFIFPFATTSILFLTFHQSSLSPYAVSSGTMKVS